MDKQQAAEIRKKAITVLELTKGFTPEQRSHSSNEFKTMEELAYDILELTSWEACEAQPSPSDAVALLKQVPQQMINASEGLTDYDFLQEVNDFIKNNPSGSSPAATQAVGPVWVKASQKLPDPGIDRPARRKGFHMNIRVDSRGVIHVGGMTCHSTEILEEWFSGLEWLDESQSGQQLFTREQVEEVAKIAMTNTRDETWKNYGDITQYMNTNYPNQ